MMKIARKYSLRSYISARGPDTQVRQKLFQKPQQVSRKRVSVCLWHQQHAILRTVESWMLPQREVSLSSCKVAITIYAAPKPCSAVNMPCLCYFTYPQHITTLTVLKDHFQPKNVGLSEFWMFLQILVVFLAVSTVSPRSPKIQKG